MSVVIHSTAVLDGSAPAYLDRALLGLQRSIANGAGAAGATVQVAVSFPSGELPASYNVHIDANQACFAFASAKTAFGFTVNLVPTSNTTSIAAGNFGVTVVA